ncbi:MAG: TonB family protein [Candidatus Omnitrophica bacterium]|nr:TonB family protein [Candidatus Omnitrophota bacterium]
MCKKINAFIMVSLIPVLMLVLVGPILAGDAPQETLKLLVGETKIIPTQMPTRVIIGNPLVADISNVTETEIALSAKSPGQTSLVYWDTFGEQSENIKVIREDMTLIKQRVDNLLGQLDLPEVYTKAEEDEGKVIILGRVKTSKDKERIALALNDLKDKISDLVEVKEEETVIEIDVQILELNKDATKTLGFSWPGSMTLTEVGSSGIQAAGTTWGKLFHVANITRAAFTLKLDALIQEGKARILSRPRLSCQTNKEAQLLVGGEKPVFTTAVSTGGSSSTNVEYKEYGIKLKIKPSVTEDDRIKLNLYVEVSDVGEAEILGSEDAPTAKAYPLSKRSVSSELYLNNGQIMAIGGLIKQKTEEDLRKFPWLADIPVLGLFFRQRVTKIGKGQGARDDTELFVTLVPTIVARDEPKGKKPSSDSVAEKKQESFNEPELPGSLGNYVRIVKSKIVKSAYYPQQAKNAGWEGNVRLNLNITASGALKGIKLVQSSGYKVLDDAAYDIAKKQAPYPPFPPQIESQELWVDVPIDFRNN